MKFYSQNIRKVLFLIASILPFFSLSQFAPQAGFSGTTAIHKDSSIIATFANYKLNGKGIDLIRGYQNALDTNLGYASIGSADSLFLSPQGYMLSLGDGGSITIELPYPVINGPGPDFVVFENGFPFSSDSFFLELAFVEVSTDGKTFHRFISFSKTDTLEQIGPFGGLKAHHLHNLAGKYIMPFGVPFDLSELSDSINGPVTHLRITDVVGSILTEIGSRDYAGNLINDPWPTPFPSSGFDLHAIGYIHFAIPESLNEKIGIDQVSIFPNPILYGSEVTIESTKGFNELKITNSFGEVVLKKWLSQEIKQENILLQLNPGLYNIEVINEGSFIYNQKLIVL